MQGYKYVPTISLEDQLASGVERALADVLGEDHFPTAEYPELAAAFARLWWAATTVHEDLTVEEQVHALLEAQTRFARALQAVAA